MKNYAAEFLPEPQAPRCVKSGERGRKTKRALHTGAHWWEPTASQIRYVRACVESGYQASWAELAKAAGVNISAISAWRRNKHFVDWANREILRRLTAKIPAGTAYVLGKWVSKLVSDIRLHDHTGGLQGRYPSTADIRRILDLADKFDLDGQAKTDKTYNFNMVQVVGQGLPNPEQLVAPGLRSVDARAKLLEELDG